MLNPIESSKSGNVGKSTAVNQSIESGKQDLDKESEVVKINTVAGGCLGFSGRGVVRVKQYIKRSLIGPSNKNKPQPPDPPLRSSTHSQKSRMMPPSESFQQALFYPFHPSLPQKSFSEKALSLEGLEDYSSERDSDNLSTANTRGMYRTEVDGQDYFVKRVGLEVAQAAQVIERISALLGMTDLLLPVTYVENPQDKESAFLISPLLKKVKDVDTSCLKKVFSGKDLEVFLSNMFVFDHIISNTDRTGIKQLMESRGAVYLADQDDSLCQNSFAVDDRMSGHIIEQYAEELGLEYKDFPIEEKVLKGARKMIENLDELLTPLSMEEHRERVRESLVSGIKGVLKAGEMPSPTLRELYWGSATMNAFMGLEEK